jgi:hypothetical protein
MLLADDVAGDTAVVHLDAIPLADGLADVRWLLHDVLMTGPRTGLTPVIIGTWPAPAAC